VRGSTESDEAQVHTREPVGLLLFCGDAQTRRSATATNQKLEPKIHKPHTLFLSLIVEQKEVVQHPPPQFMY